MAAKIFSRLFTFSCLPSCLILSFVLLRSCLEVGQGAVCSSFSFEDEYLMWGPGTLLLRCECTNHSQTGIWSFVGKRKNFENRSEVPGTDSVDKRATGITHTQRFAKNPTGPELEVVSALGRDSMRPSVHTYACPTCSCVSFI